MSEIESSTPASTSARGPVGETRSVGLSVLWLILTLGIYGIYWVYKTQEEVKRDSGTASAASSASSSTSSSRQCSSSSSVRKAHMYKGLDGGQSPVRGIRPCRSCSQSPGPVVYDVGSLRCRERSTATGNRREPRPPRLPHGAGGQAVAGRARPGMERAGRRRRRPPACHARHAGALRLPARPPISAAASGSFGPNSSRSTSTSRRCSAPRWGGRPADHADREPAPALAPRRTEEPLLVAANRAAIAATVFLAAGMSASVYLITDFLFGEPATAAVTATLGALFIFGSGTGSRWSAGDAVTTDPSGQSNPEKQR